MSTKTSPNPVQRAGQTQALIKRLRTQWGMSQSEISRLTNIPQPRLSRWEAGEVSAGADDALRLQALVNEKEAASGPRRRASDKQGTTSP
jgi:DNA-binding transcriptional regulator YiaG